MGETEPTNRPDCHAQGLTLESGPPVGSEGTTSRSEQSPTSLSGDMEPGTSGRPRKGRGTQGRRPEPLRAHKAERAPLRARAPGLDPARRGVQTLRTLWTRPPADPQRPLLPLPLPLPRPSPLPLCSLRFLVSCPLGRASLHTGLHLPSPHAGRPGPHRLPVKDSGAPTVGDQLMGGPTAFSVGVAGRYSGQASGEPEPVSSLPGQTQGCQEEA